MKAILHLDMDAFYASVEVLDNPSLQGRAVVVGGSGRRAVVCAASYEARRFGIHSAQPMAAAVRLCPEGVFLPVRMARYREVSREIFAVFRRFTPIVEPLSVDEAFLDVTHSIRLFGAPEEIARRIKRLVLERTGLTVSAGVAPSKLVAKIASDLHKPDGLTVVPEAQVEAFLAPLPVERLWGVGKVTQRELSLLGAKTIGDLRKIPRELLVRRFGRHGLSLHMLAWGRDDRAVEPGREARSAGAEETYSSDILDLETARRELLVLAMRAARRMRRAGLRGRTVTLKVKYHDFVQITRASTLPEYTDDGWEIFRAARGLLQKTEAGARPIRLLGIALSRLAVSGGGAQMPLFPEDGIRSRQRRLNRALDAICGKFGDDAVLPGSLLEGRHPGGNEDE